MRPEPLGKVLFYLAAAFLFPAVLLGLEGRAERPIWEDALTLLLPGGAVLMLYGVLTHVGRAIWIGYGADAPRTAGTVLLALGVSSVGCGLVSIGADVPGRLLTIPGILLLGYFSTLMVLGRTPGRRAFVEYGREPGWGARAGAWMFAFTWPLLLLWALGVIDL